MSEPVKADRAQTRQWWGSGDIAYFEVNLTAFALGLLASTACLAVATLLPAGGRNHALLLVEAMMFVLALLLLVLGRLLRDLAMEGIMKNIGAGG